MKKLGLTIAALLALCLAFTSCSNEATKVLDADDVTADWVEKYKWSGTSKITLTVDCDDSVITYVNQFLEMMELANEEVEITEEELEAKDLKGIIENDGKEIEGVKFETCVKTNWNKTALYIEQISTMTCTEEDVGFNATIKTTTITNVTADK